MRETLIEKLRPDRFSAMSGKMAAIVGYIFDERFSDPAISELVVTSDGFVLAQSEGEVGANDMIGEERDLNRNLLTLIEAAGLSDEEIREFCQGTVGTERWRSRELDAGGQEGCTLAVTRTERLEFPSVAALRSIKAAHGSGAVG